MTTQNDIAEKTNEALSQDQINAAFKLGFIIYFLGRVKENPTKVKTGEGISFLDQQEEFQWVSKTEVLKWQHASVRNDEARKMTSNEFDILITLYPGFGKTCREESGEKVNYYYLAY